jgi:Mg2+ and Co2+ transporter CorA
MPLINIVDIFWFNVITGMFGMNYTIPLRLLPLGVLVGYLDIL